MKKLIPLFVLLSLNSFASHKVIYGEDNRVDVFETTNPDFKRYAASTLARIDMTDLKGWKFSKLWEMKLKTLSDRNICKDERFVDQPVIAGCTAFLVSPKHIVTAGHCISNKTCKSGLYYWVFDYHMPEAGPFNPKQPKENFVSCKSVVKREYNSRTRADYALIELKKEVKGRAPLKFRTEGAVNSGEDLVIIGHPSGLPTKIADGAKVGETGEVFFKANLDAFGGNSGSPVINVNTGLVEGILVRGLTDYVRDVPNYCDRPIRVSDDTSGEAVTNITLIKELQNL